MNMLLATITMAGVWAWTVAHQLIIGWIVAVMIDQLPAPAQNGNAFYRWFFGVVQYLAANLTRGTKGVQGKLGLPAPAPKGD